MCLVGMAAFEPAASCSQISMIWSPDVAPCRLAWGSAGEMLAGCRLTSPGGCARWLPLWLQGGEAGRGSGRTGPGGQPGHPACCARFHENPAGGGDCGPGMARRGHLDRAGRPDARARSGAARRLDTQPAVLREAPDARLHLGHPPVPASSVTQHFSRRSTSTGGLAGSPSCAKLSRECCTRTPRA